MTHPRHALGRSVGLTAFVWGYPLVEMLRTCRLQTGDPAAAWHAPIDRLRHTPRVADATDRDIVTPANDLLYTTGWIHLAHGPRRLTVPPLHSGRYLVLALYDAWTENFANPGLRTSPRAGETVLLVGPDAPPDAGAGSGLRVLRAPTRLVWLIGRVVAGDQADLPAARALQAGIALAADGEGPPPAAVGNWQGPPEDTVAALEARPHEAEAIAARFFDNLCRGLAGECVPAADAGLLAWLSSAGLQPHAAFSFAQLDEPLRKGLVQGLADGVALLVQASRSRHARPWALNTRIGRYGTAYLVRALTAYKGLGALAPEEALYAMSDFDAHGQPLDGRVGYALRFAPGELPPVDGFWSVTLYAEDRFLHPNASGRHSIGDRTPGLRPDPDGGLTIHVGHEPPADPAARTNWLPAPAGRCYLVLRLYVPRPEARGWAIPPLRPLAPVAPPATGATPATP